ncbi:MAG: Sec-independent protein translocase protein TatB [Pseudomonadota bacterium]
MFDIGFAELLIIAVVSLLVIGPERLPSAIRTGSVWLNRFRRGFNEIKQEVQQELHNDEVMRELRESGEKLRRETDALRKDLSDLNPAAELMSTPGEAALNAPKEAPKKAPKETPKKPASQAPESSASDANDASGANTAVREETPPGDRNPS